MRAFIELFRSKPAAQAMSLRNPLLAQRAPKSHRVFTMSSTYQATYDKLCQHMREAAMLNSMQGLLGWDERTNLPPAGGEYRAEQMSYLAGVIHKKQIAPEVGEWLVALSDSPLAADRHSDTG